MGIYLQKLTVDEEVNIPEWLEHTALALSHPDAVKIAAQLTAENEKNTRFSLFNHLKTMLMLPAHTNDTFVAEMVQKTREKLILGGAATENNRLRVDTDLDAFLAALERFRADFATDEYFFENFAVTVFFYQSFPLTNSKEALWKSYINFCNIYSFARFMAICAYLEPAADEQAQKAALFRALAFVSRTLLHDSTRSQNLRDEFFSTGSATLAHMQTLLSL